MENESGLINRGEASAEAGISTSSVCVGGVGWGGVD